MADVRKKAQELGLKAHGVQKPHLIRAIQTAEGNTSCFAFGRETCDQVKC